VWPNCGYNEEARIICVLPSNTLRLANIIIKRTTSAALSHDEGVSQGGVVWHMNSCQKIMMSMVGNDFGIARFSFLAALLTALRTVLWK
jgi:hypothetical protein